MGETNGFTHLYVENPQKAAEVAGKEYFLDQALCVTPVPHGTILPLKARTDIFAINAVYAGGVCDEQMNFAAGYERRKGSETTNYSCHTGYTVSPDAIQTSGETVYFGGILFEAFGHLMLDTLSRLWWLAEPGHPRHKVAFVLRPGHKPPTFQFFRWLGLQKDDIIIVDTPTRFANVLVPDQSFYSFTGYTSAFVRMYDFLRDRVPAGASKKLYLTRRQFAGNDCLNEEYFEAFYRRRGFEVVAPEQLDLEQQISLLAGAQEVACTMGTLSHLILFAQDNVRLTILNRAENTVVVPQALLNQMRRARCCLVDASMNFLPTVHTKGRFLLGPTRCWQRFLEEENILYSQQELAMDKEEWFCRYLYSWCENYADPSQYKILSKKDMADVVTTMNQVLNHRTVRRADLETGGAYQAKSFYIEQFETARPPKPED